jgi:zinc finger protein
MVVGESNGEGAKDKIRRNELEVFSVDDLNATVVRSSFASIEIPELGVRVEPKRGEAFVSNVEGVLQRVEKVVEMLSRDEEGEKRAKAAAIVKKIAQIKAGEANMTLILDDPTGNSAIISDKVKHHRDNDQKSK